MLLQWVRNNIYCGKPRKIAILKPKKKNAYKNQCY